MSDSERLSALIDHAISFYSDRSDGPRVVAILVADPIYAEFSSIFPPASPSAPYTPYTVRGVPVLMVLPGDAMPTARLYAARHSRDSSCVILSVEFLDADPIALHLLKEVP